MNKAMLEIEMPESCYECPLKASYKPSSGSIRVAWCAIHPEITIEDFRAGRASFCPLKEAPTVDAVAGNWISVYDRLPEDESLILAYHPNYIIPTPGQKPHDVDRITIKFGWYCRRSALGITHWMPLPEPPCGAKMSTN